MEQNHHQNTTYMEGKPYTKPNKNNSKQTKN
jgi:hypothetical protein